MDTDSGWFGPDPTHGHQIGWGAVCATGLLVIGAPTALQVLWLLVLGVAAAAGPRAVEKARRAASPGRGAQG